MRQIGAAAVDQTVPYAAYFLMSALAAPPHIPLLCIEFYFHHYWNVALTPAIETNQESTNPKHSNANQNMA